jgi:hypothetical protein
MGTEEPKWADWSEAAAAVHLVTPCSKHCRGLHTICWLDQRGWHVLACGTWPGADNARKKRAR